MLGKPVFVLRETARQNESFAVEGDGFLLMYKRLDNGCFQWPRSGAEAKLLTHEQYIWLLQGLSVEQPKAIKQAPKKDVI